MLSCPILHHRPRQLPRPQQLRLPSTCPVASVDASTVSRLSDQPLARRQSRDAGASFSRGQTAVLTLSRRTRAVVRAREWWTG